MNEAAAGGAGAEGRERRGGYEHDRDRDRAASGYRDDDGSNAAARAKRSSSPRQQRGSDQGEPRQYSEGRRGGRSSSSPGAAGRARRQGSESEGRQAGRGADRSTPEQRGHHGAGTGDPGSSSRRQSGSHDRSRGSSREMDHQQQRAAGGQSGGVPEQPPSTGLSRQSAGSKHTPIVFDLPPPPPANEGDLLPLRSSRSEDRGPRGPGSTSGQAARQEQQQQQRGGRERPAQEQGRADSRQRGEVRRSSSPGGRGREAGRDAPPRHVHQLSPEPFKRSGAAPGDRGDSGRRGQEVDRSRERGGRGGDRGPGSDPWRGQAQPHVEVGSRDRASRGRSDRAQDDDWSWRPDDAQQQVEAVKQPMEVPAEARSRPQQQRTEGQADRQAPVRPSVVSPRAARQAPASGPAPSGHGQQAEQPHRERPVQQDAPALTPAGEQRALRKQREERRAAAVQQQLRAMHFSKALLEPPAWRQLLQVREQQGGLRDREQQDYVHHDGRRCCLCQSRAPCLCVCAHCMCAGPLANIPCVLVKALEPRSRRHMTCPAAYVCSSTLAVHADPAAGEDMSSMLLMPLTLLLFGRQRTCQRRLWTRPWPPRSA